MNLRCSFIRSLLGLSVALASATTSPADDSVTVSGTATYRQRIAMPPEALLTVRVEDVSRADAPAGVVAEIREPFGAR